MSHFIAYLTRMRYINRWNLMRNTKYENILEHSEHVSVIAHMLAMIGNVRYKKGWNEENAALLAMYHEFPEVITGDLPSPIKYFDADITSAYKNVEIAASKKLLSTIPKDLRSKYEKYFIDTENENEWILVKMADKISAYIKCVEELQAGNNEFKAAKQALQTEIDACDLEEVKAFMNEFIPSCSMTLDELI